MTWASVILAALQLANGFMNYVNRETAVQSGADAEIAKAAAAILAKTQAAQEIMKQVTGMTDQQVDDALKALES